MVCRQRAATHATDVATEATDVATHATDAATHATDAATHATDVATHATDVATHTTDAATHATDAATHATNAATHATDATRVCGPSCDRRCTPHSPMDAPRCLDVTKVIELMQQMQECGQPPERRSRKQLFGACRRRTPRG